MENETICVNNYLTYYPIYKNSLHDTILRNKYEKINKNKKEYFENVKVVNFDIINSECRKDPLQSSVEYYQTIKQDDLKNVRESDKEEFISAAIRSRRDDGNTTDSIKFKKKNKILFSSMYGRKKKKEYDLAIAFYSYLKI